jgi:hypothetical protein
MACVATLITCAHFRVEICYHSRNVRRPILPTPQSNGIDVPTSLLLRADEVINARDPPTISATRRGRRRASGCPL